MTGATRGPARAGLLLALLLAGLVGALAGSSPAASAHAYIESLTPGDGAVLQTAPSSVRVTFSEKVTLAATDQPVRLEGENGRSVQAGRARLTGGDWTLVIGVASGLKRGVYTASWTVISADSHPVTGSVRFGYRADVVAAATPDPPSPDGRWGALVGALKGALYLVLGAGLGLLPAAYLTGVGAQGRRQAARWARRAIVLAGVLSLAQLPAQFAWDVSALPGRPGLSSFVDPLSGAYATTVWVRLVALLALYALLRVGIPRSPGPIGRRTLFVLGALLSVLVIVTVVRNGHGGTDLVRLAVAGTHAVAAVAWTGGVLLFAALAVRGAGAGEWTGTHRWSGFAAGCVAALALTGAVQALMQVRHWPALWETQYGRLLIVKVAIALVAGGAALLARRVLGTRASGPERAASSGANGRLRDRTRVEAGALAAVLLLSGLLASSTPTNAEYAPDRVASSQLGPYRVTATVSPARTGPSGMRVLVVGRDDNAPMPQTLRVTLRHPDRGGELRVDFPYRLPGTLRPGHPTPTTFASGPLTFPIAGDWTATLTLVAGPTTQYVEEFAVPVV